ncbi:MAG: HEAT repeat domain-containing protein, partial [Cyanobacteria bacterium P01_A01_bin.84]
GKIETVFTSAIAKRQFQSPVYKFTPGQSFTYKINYQNISTSDLRVLFNQNQTSENNSSAGVNSFVNNFQISILGELVVTVLQKQGNNILVSQRLQNSQVKIISSGQEIIQQAQLIQNDLQREIFTTLNSQGKLMTVRFDPVVSEIAQNFGRSLLGLAQFVTPNEEVKNGEWKTLEGNPNGEYIARYSAGIGTFKKTKLRYLQSESQQNPNDSQVATIIKPEGEMVAKFNHELGYLVSLQGKELQKFIVSGKNVGSSSTNLDINYKNQTKLSNAELEQLQEANIANQKLVKPQTLFVQPNEAETEAKIQRQELGDATLESLLIELDKAEASQNENNTSLYLKFKALVYLKPETSKILGERLLKAKADSLSMQIISGALGNAGNPQAQSALVKAIAFYRRDWDVLSVLIPSLATVNSPIQEAEDIILDLAFNSSDTNIASTAQLALGTIANNLAKTSPQRSHKIVERFVKALETTKSEQQIRQYLLVLGNAGSPKSLKAIASLTKAKQPKIRATALLALRWIDDKQAETLLTDALIKDTDDGVRLEAAVALGFRKMSPHSFQTQKQAFTSDRSIKVRLSLLKNLWEVRTSFPEVNQIVTQTAQNDVSPDVRKAATNLIKMSN